MSYVNSAVGTLVTALLLGAVTGAGEVFTSALAKLSPEDKQVLYAAGVSDVLNNTAFFVLLLLPLAVVLVFFVRRWRGGPAPGSE